MEKDFKFKQNKTFLSSIAPENFSYIGYFDGHYNYQKRIRGHYKKIDAKTQKVIPDKYVLIKAIKEDLSKENLQLMADKQLTRV